MEQSFPLVTVAGLCYNHSRYVIETLESIKQQTYPNLEVILIDDCSTDDSVAVIEDWLIKNEPGWRFIKHQKNLGVSKTLNESIAACSGTYFKAIACDDILLPECVDALVNALHPLSKEYAFVYSDVLTINEDGNVFGQTPFAERGWMKDEDVPSGKLFVHLSQLCFIPAPSTLIKTEVLKKLKFDESLHFEDWDMWFRISKEYLIKGISRAVVKYRIHRHSMFQAKSPVFLDAELRTVEKQLGYDAEADRYLNDFIYRNSILLYMQNGKRPLHWLWKRFRIRKTAKNFLHVILAIMGISYQQKEKWRK